MARMEFVNTERQKAIRKAINYWYKNLYRQLTLVDFIDNCTWKKVGRNYVVIYKGQESKNK